MPTRTHLARERNHKLVANKRKQALQKHGKLACEICTPGAEHLSGYGSPGKGLYMGGGTRRLDAIW